MTEGTEGTEANMDNLLNELQDTHGAHTSLVTFTVSGNSSYTLATQRVNAEIGTAGNIKSRV